VQTATASPPDFSPNLYCIICGYNQRGITAERCPECGQDFSKVPPSPSRLPWLHRRHLGLLRSYWRTAAMVIFRPKIFLDQIDNPITLKDARLFWLLSILQACLPLVILLVFFVANNPPGRLEALKQSLFRSFFLPVPNFFFILPGVVLFFIVATGMPSYFCHPRALPIARQNKAIALSYFASAPIALMPLIFALAVVAEYVEKLEVLSMMLSFVAVALACFMLLAWYIRSAGIVLALSRRPHRVLTVLLLSLCWVFVLILFLILIPLGVWYVAVTSRILT